MAVSGPQNQGLPGYTPVKPPKPIVNTTGVGPQDVGLPGYRPGDTGNPNGPLAPGLSAPAPLQAAAPVPAAAAPVDYWAASALDPQYITGDADLKAANQASLASLQKGFLGQAQGYQDNANAHGALFSGAAIHSQNYAAQNYADAQAAAARNLLSGEHTLQSAVFTRMLSQLSGVTN